MLVANQCLCPHPSLDYTKLAAMGNVCCLTSGSHTIDWVPPQQEVTKWTEERTQSCLENGLWILTHNVGNGVGHWEPQIHGAGVHGSQEETVTGAHCLSNDSPAHPPSTACPIWATGSTSVTTACETREGKSSSPPRPPKAAKDIQSTTIMQEAQHWATETIYFLPSHALETAWNTTAS